jgi:hypothetical protein
MRKSRRSFESVVSDGDCFFYLNFFPQRYPILMETQVAIENLKNLKFYL